MSVMRSYGALADTRAMREGDADRGYGFAVAAPYVEGGALQRVHRILDQGSAAACVGYATAAMIEGLESRAVNPLAIWRDARRRDRAPGNVGTYPWSAMCSIVWRGAEDDDGRRSLVDFLAIDNTVTDLDAELSADAHRYGSGWERYRIPTGIDSADDRLERMATALTKGDAVMIASPVGVAYSYYDGRRALDSFGSEYGGHAQRVIGYGQLTDLCELALTRLPAAQSEAMHRAYDSIGNRHVWVIQGSWGEDFGVGGLVLTTDAPFTSRTQAISDIHVLRRVSS